MNFFDVLAAEKWGSGIPTINFFDLLFAQSLGGGEQWETYEGTLPATINANGDDMRQYQIYGNTGCVGDKTKNIYNTTETTWSANGIILDNDGIPITASSHYTTNFTAVNPETSYYMYGTFRAESLSNRIYFYDENKIWLSRTELIDTRFERTFVTPANCKFIQIQASNRLVSTDDWCITPGTTSPETYVPYGYEVDMGVSDGTTSTTTPIYIGDTPLGEDEYVDYGEQKVFRRTVQLFDKDAALDGYEIVNNGMQRNDNWCVSDFIPVESNALYKSRDSGGAVLGYTDKNERPTRLNGTLNTNGVTTLSGTKFIKMNCQISKKASCIVAKSEDLPETYIPYHQPTDPPVPLPALPTIDGTTIVDYAGSGTAPEKVYLEYKGGT